MREKTLLAGAALSLGLSLAWLSCSSKKETAAKTSPVERPACPIARLTVTPDRAADPALTLGSGREVLLEARAADAAGRPMNAEVVWRFKDAPLDQPGLTAGSGHTLAPTGPRTAVFRASGKAADDFWVAAAVPDCADADSIAVSGLARITVAPDPDGPARCGRIRVRYGSRDLVDESVLGFVTLNFWAEVYTRPERKEELAVRFYLNDRPLNPLRKLYPPLDDEPAADFPAHYRARLPVFLERGGFRVFYELRQGEAVVCASPEVSFATR